MGEEKYKKIVFVVEPEAFLARVICRGLMKAGFKAKYLPTGEAAINLLSEQQPDFLIVATDIQPMSGEEFCRRLHSEHPDRTFPVFVMSDSAQDMHSRWNHWFSNFRIIDKPISLRFIVEAMERHQEQEA